MRKSIILTAMAMLIALPAFAFDLGGYLGPVELKFSGYGLSGDTRYDPGVDYGLDETYLVDYGPGGGAPAVYPETWTIMKLTSIEIPGGGGQPWSSSASGEDIYGMIYGLYDWDVSVGGSGVIVSQIGGWFDLYLDTDADDSNEWITDLDPTLATSRTAKDGYKSVTDTTGAVSFLSGTFSPGVQSPEPAGGPGGAYTTVRQDVTLATSPTTGAGTGYADLTGGNYMSMFDGNGMVDGYGVHHDLFFQFDLYPAVDNPLTAGDETALWSQSLNDPVRGNVVPEPTSLLLLGSGLMGLLGVGFRKKKKS
jgi:hypothetical protein